MQDVYILSMVDIYQILYDHRIFMTPIILEILNNYIHKLKGTMVLQILSLEDKRKLIKGNRKNFDAIQSLIDLKKEGYFSRS